MDTPLIVNIDSKNPIISPVSDKDNSILVVVDFNTKIEGDLEIFIDDNPVSYINNKNGSYTVFLESSLSVNTKISDRFKEAYKNVSSSSLRVYKHTKEIVIKEVKPKLPDTGFKEDRILFMLVLGFISLALKLKLKCKEFNY